MLTLMPYADFGKSARVLDDKRLGRQRMEAMKILTAINNPADPMHVHRGVRMWRGFETALIWYMNSCVREWIRRGHINRIVMPVVPLEYELPNWLGNETIHATHRAALLAKDFAYYSKFGWKEEPKTAYLWPLSEYEKTDEL